MRMAIRVMLLLAALWPCAATAGLRASYAADGRRPVRVEIADNGDFTAELSRGQRLVMKSGEAFIVQERLTGPIVTRVRDLAEAAPRRQRDDGGSGAEDAMPVPAERGTAEVFGRIGRAFYFPARPDARPSELEPAIVISDDPALAPLAPVMRQLFETELLLEEIAGNFPPGLSASQREILDIIADRAPLRFANRRLRSGEVVAIAADAISLPAEPETRAAMQARLAAELREEESTGRPQIARAVYGAGRLWLLDDSDGALSSMAEGDASRTRHDVGAPVLDVCAYGDVVYALTGTRDGAQWSLRQLEGAGWRTVRTIRRARDVPLALSCTRAAGSALLTTRRLIDLESAGRAGLALSEPLRGGRVATVLYSTPAAAFVGLNAGEWGGGLRRIDRRTGRVTTIERNATGGLCDGPLNSECDPVHAIIGVPWQPDCIAAAIGLMHMISHGRIVQICPGGRVEQLFAAMADGDPDDPRQAADASSGSYGAAAFYGLIPSGDGMIGASNDGLYRIERAGVATHQAWPRFVEVDGVLVSFALPEAVLVVTGINGRAALSGSTPLLVPR